MSRTCKQRAADVADLIGIYVERTSGEAQEPGAQDLAGLLCDLRHWAAREGVDFVAAWDVATANFEAELRGEDEDDPRDLQAAHPELYEFLVHGDDLAEDDWQQVTDFINHSSGPAFAPDDAPGGQIGDPPWGIADNAWRARRVHDLVSAYAARTGLFDDEPRVQLGDMLCDIRHWSVQRHITIAAPALPGQARAPWQQAVEFWVDEMLGVDGSGSQPLRDAVPDLVAQVELSLNLAPGRSHPAARISPAQWKQLNQLAYWELNPDAPAHDLPPIQSLGEALFDGP